MLYIVTKEVILNLRLTDDLREDFRVVALLRGATMSSLLHQFMVKSVREEKANAPAEFEAVRRKILESTKLRVRDTTAKDKAVSGSG